MPLSPLPLRLGLDGRFMTDAYPGIGRYVYNLAQALPAAEVEISLLIDPTAVQTRFDLRRLERPGVRFVPVRHTPRHISDWWQLPRLVRQLQCQVFHSPHLGFAARLPCPSVVTICDLIPIRVPDAIPSRLSRYGFTFGVRRALRQSDQIVTISQASQRDLVAYSGARPERIAVTPLAVEACFKPAPAACIAALRTRLALPEQYVLYIGAHKPHKNLVRLVKAWAQLKLPQGEHWALVIAGRQDARFPDVQREVRALGLRTVHFVGHIAEPDLPALYSGAKAYIQPSLWEGFGLPVLEAMACEVPVVCANTDALVEVTGTAAIHFSPQDVGQIATALTRVMCDTELRQQLITRGRHHVQTFSWQETARQTLDVYQAVRAAGLSKEGQERRE
jgi:glycosyltransferase involved in cell wall biosynthesis